MSQLNLKISDFTEAVISVKHFEKYTDQIYVSFKKVNVGDSPCESGEYYLSPDDLRAVGKFLLAAADK